MNNMSLRREEKRRQECLHEGSIANPQLNLVPLVYGVSVLPLCCQLLPYEENKIVCV